ncbi:MAG: Trk system potassium transporter TrkA [bacterium]
MKIIIVGGGVVGYSLAEQLLKDKHHLSLVELDSHLCRTIAEKLDLQILNGSGTSPSLLVEAGLSNADMVLAVTPNDQVNTVVCAIAAQYDVSQRIARLRSREFTETSKLVDLQKLGITSVIHPEQVLVEHILQYVQTPHALESADFEHGKILMRGYRITDKMELAGKTPSEIRQEITPDVVLFAAIVRQGRGMIPYGDTVIESGDILYSLFPRESRERFLRLVGVEKKDSRKIIMTGDAYAALELARVLDKSEHPVTFVHPDLQQAQTAASLFNRVEVLHGDCTEPDLLGELNVDTASFFIAASEGADYNMLSGLLAKAEGAHEVIVTSTESRHDRLFKSIGIDHVINPRLTTAREILEIISRGHIGAVVKFSSVDIEAVRFTVDPDSLVANTRVKEIAGKLKRRSIIGVIVRGDSMILPDGETIIEPDDHVIMITHDKNLPTVSRLFKPRRSSRRG